MERDAEDERARHARARNAIEQNAGETDVASLDDTGPEPGENAAVEDV